MDERRIVRTELPESIQRALLQIEAHPHVQSIEGKARVEDGWHGVTVHIETNLPAAWRARGESPETGVRLIEAVEFWFPATFPVDAPEVYLRQDFNRALAHVQPGDATDSVRPCYLDGDARELLQQRGILGILDQVVIWLERAAKNQLIDPQHGWEPIRRDVIEDYVAADIEMLRALVTRREELFFLPVAFMKLMPKRQTAHPAKGYWFYASVDAAAFPIKRQTLIDINDRRRRIDDMDVGPTFAIFVAPGNRPDGKPFVCEQYAPETVRTLSDLLERAHAYGCGKALDDALTHLKEKSANLTSAGSRLPVVVLLTARRPTHLIGATSDLEIIPYLLEMTAPGFTEPYRDVSVHPVAMRHQVSPALLQRLSGTTGVEERRVVQLGAGSLGSKLAIHLARAGLAPTHVVDKAMMSPHNATRFGVTTEPDHPFLSMVSKVYQVTEAVRSLKQACERVELDVASSAAAALPDLYKVIPPKTWAAINSTASLVVRETLANISPDVMEARIIETSLYARCAVGVLTVEGPTRNPNTADLMLETYELVRQDDALRDPFFGSPLERREVGQGCGSVTLIASDAEISLFAAAMAIKVQQLRQHNLPSTGQIYLGSRNAEGMGLAWSRHDIAPYHRVTPANERAWRVRVSPRAHAAIAAECARHPDTETGGIVVGSVSELRRTITVTNVLPAPPDSKRSAAEFVLGTEGVTQAIEAYASVSRYTLHAVGTWHSHLSDAGASSRDYKTSAILGAQSLLPLALLIRTPTGYRAILAQPPLGEQA